MVKVLRLLIKGFQSTHPHGVRLSANGDGLVATKFQSTHPHGVRPRTSRRLRKSVEFQSTHPHGVRPRTSRRLRKSVEFQSTHPHGVRRLPNFRAAARRSFNPRTHTGCDESVRDGVIHDVIVSIHAPTRGATRNGQSVPSSVLVSIHAPTRGATIYSAY